MSKYKWNYLFTRAYDRYKDSRRIRRSKRIKRLARGIGRRQMPTEINKPVDIALRDLHIDDYMEVKEK